MKKESKKPGEPNGSQVSVLVSIDDFFSNLTELKRAGQFPFGPDFQVREEKIFSVSITFGWSDAESALSEVYEGLKKFVPEGVEPRDVVEIIYDEDSPYCEAMEFFDGIVQATPLEFRSCPGYDFQFIFEEE